jgi:hypothetical protein
MNDLVRAALISRSHVYSAIRQVQSSDQCDGAEFTALAAEERAENSEVLKF